MNGDPLIQDLTASECLDCLATVRVGRVGLTIRALPAIRPVRFALTAGHVVFRARTNSRLHMAASGSFRAS
jgi:uncharacterized protein